MSDLVYRASYESDELAQKRAREAGWNGPDDEVGMLDYIDVHGGEDSVARNFTDKSEAEKWLVEQINLKKTLFGCGDIDVLKRIDPNKRCRYCVCRGLREIKSFIVDDTGIAEERECGDDCWDGDQ